MATKVHGGVVDVEKAGALNSPGRHLVFDRATLEERDYWLRILSDDLNGASPARALA